MTQIDYSALQSELGEQLILPDTSTYDSARNSWNALFDKHPGAVAKCQSAEHVAACVRFAAANDIAVSVRSGGHSYAGKSSNDGGLVIDVSAIDHLEIDAENKTLRVGPGVKWDRVIRECAEHGLVVPSPPPQTGVGGVATSGGVGLLSRKWGLTVDNVLAVDMVSAAGEALTASADANAELFWAVRGGLGNFGVATSFELQLHELPDQVLGGQLLYAWEDAADALAFLRDFMKDAPNEVGVFALAFVLPPLEFFPEHLHLKSCLAFSAVYAGPAEEAEAALAPLRAHGSPFADTIAPQPWNAIFHADDAAIEAWDRVYCKSHNLPELSDEAIAVFVEHGGALAGDVTLLGLLPMNGAISEVPSNAMAFAPRSGAWEFDIWASWSDPAQDGDIQAWTKKFADAMSPHADGSVYVNILGADEADRIPAAFGDNWERLRALKSTWDPNNLFSENHNIPPA